MKNVIHKKVMNKKKITIYSMTHKFFDFPESDLYQPLFVGHKLHPEYNLQGTKYLSDANGDNISEDNPYYSELTGVYWVWKNVIDQDYVGICHYRRYLQNAAGKIFDKSQILQILNHYDVMTTKKVILDHSYLDGFSGKHNRNDLIVTGDVIKEKYPEYYQDYDRYVNQNTTYFGNMMICKKDLYDRYCEWLFGILFEVQKRIDISNYNDYQKRVFGFISELLLMVYLEHNNLKVYECNVAVIGEKKETKETKEQLAKYILKGDIEGAKKYFLSVYEKRPDVLMEASDTNGDLKLCMQIITTLDYEQKENAFTTNYGTDFEQMLCDYKALNRSINNMISGQMSRDDYKVIIDKKFSNIAYIIALKILCPYDIKRQEQYFEQLLSLK